MTFNEFITEWKSDSDTIKCHTSGSTGEPKEIMLDKNFVAESADRTISFFHLKEGSKLHSCISPDTIGGKMMAVRSELCQGILSYETPSNRPLKDFNPEDVLDLVAVVPSQVPFLLKNIATLPKIRNLLIGGSPIPSSLRKEIAESKLNAYESYGMTETASHIAIRPVTENEIPFTLLQGISISLTEDNCLKIKFTNGYEILTNDLAKIISEKEFIILGRKDQVIITGGKKVNPISLENKLSSIIKVPFIITSMTDQKWGEKIVLLIEGEMTDKEKQALSEETKKLLNKWEVPKEIYSVKELPRTSNGKISRVKDSFLNLI